MGQRSLRSDDGLLLTPGNDKTGPVLIFNLGPASTCPSKTLGLCGIQDRRDCVCYALEAERFFPNVLSFRVHQARFWRRSTVTSFCRSLDRLLFKTRRHFDGFRFGESGDFYTQHDLEKADGVAGHLKEDCGFEYVWALTSRRDLRYKSLRFINVIGSGFDTGMGESCVIGLHDPVPEGFQECTKKCSSCFACARPGAKIAFRIHGGYVNVVTKRRRRT